MDANSSASSDHQAQLEIDSFADEDDGFVETNTASYCSSIASDIRKGRLENGRIYPAYGGHEYGLPVDESELERHDMQHYKYTLLLDDKLYLAPIPENPSRILDLGTGTGIWAIEVAEKFPTAQVIGTDVAPVQPACVPPNCRFEIDDAEDDWQFTKESFDFIHNRDFILTVRDWPKLVRQCYDHLKPGGYLELACVWPVPKSDDNTLPANSAYVEVCHTFMQIGKYMDADPDAPLHYHQFLKDAGFQNVRQKVFKIPTSPWVKGERMKKIGALEVLNLLDGAQAFLLRGWTMEMGRMREELEVLLMQMRKELMRCKFHSYVQFYVVYGQKPEEPAERGDS